MSQADAPVLVTGASGNLGRVVAPLLAGLGHRLRLTANTPFPGPLPEGASFAEADLADEAAIVALAEGTRAIVHLGAYVDYGTFDLVLGPNLRGIHSVFEAARRHGLRVVNASSNHVIGFHERGQTLSIADPPRPDSYYGLSKAYGELVARYYFDRYGIESVNMRIGSCFDEPRNERMLATWLSRPDLARLIDCSLRAAAPGFAIVWGISDNSRAWWEGDDRARIGWAPRDSADAWIGRFAEPAEGATERFQGGRFCDLPADR